MGELKDYSCLHRLQVDNLRMSPVGKGLLLLAAALLFVAAIPSPAFCAVPSKASSAKGVYHRVKNGETLMGIARAYGIPVQTIAEANRIKITTRVEKDSVIFIPGAKRVIENTTPLGLAKRDKAKAVTGKGDKKERDKAKTQAKRTERDEKKATGRGVEDRKKGPAVTKKSPSEDGDDKPAAKARDKRPSGDEKRIVWKEKKDSPQRIRPAAKPDDARTAAPSGARFVWPVKGRVVSKFGLQPGGMFYNGIKIAGRPDRPIVAVAPGVVIYSSALKDYGETVIVKHNGQFATVYTNLGERTVAVDSRVKQGGKIGLMGAIEGKDEGFMTFEVRYKNKAVNPLRYLK
jgi:lipoprotein NlpD